MKKAKISPARSKPLKELENRILSIEKKEAELIKPDWSKIMNEANSI
jgi:hypothetical protein